MNREWGMGKVFIMCCVRITSALPLLYSEVSFAKMLVCLMQRRYQRVKNQDFCNNFNDFYFRKYNYPRVN